MGPWPTSSQGWWSAPVRVEYAMTTWTSGLLGVTGWIGRPGSAAGPRPRVGPASGAGSLWARGGVGVEDEAAGEQRGEDVGAAGVHGAGVVRAEAAGQPGEPGERPGGFGRGEQRPQCGHPVGLRGDHHPAVAAGVAVPRLGAFGVDGEYGAGQRGFELGRRLLGARVGPGPARRGPDRG